MTKGWRTVAASMLVSGAALCAFGSITHGFAAVTSEGVRRAEIASAPRALPSLGMIDSTGRRLALSDYAASSQHVTFVTLVYVRCQTVCLTTAAGQSWLQGEIEARGLGDRVKLLTLSFDPHNDTPTELSAYARRLDANPHFWRFATLRDARDLQAMLNLFGIVVLPDGLGGYTHNAALFLVGRDGRLSRAYDVDRPDLALADYLRGAAEP